MRDSGEGAVGLKMQEREDSNKTLKRNSKTGKK